MYCLLNAIKQIMKSFFFITAAGMLFFDCRKETGADAALPFEVTPVQVPVSPGMIDEASGIADSRNHPGHIWVQQDGGNPAEITLVGYDGVPVKKIFISGAGNRDWEDMAAGGGPVAGQDYLYIAETGDNNAVYTEYAIYRFPEPGPATDTVTGTEKIRFVYPDGPHDAEAMFTDPDTHDIYLISKRETLSRVYRLAFPQVTGTLHTAEYMGEMTISGASGAAMSANGHEILVKTYTHIYYWKRHTGESIIQALQRMPLTLGYVLEPQGEALGFRQDNSGFYTLSERPFFAQSVNLNLYKRKQG